MNIMIHSCNKRKWYVDQYLVPSIIEQGINEDNIAIWNDDKEIGNLQSCMQSFKTFSEADNDNTWHLQDDVIISRKFAETIRAYEDVPGIICGFKSHYSENHSAGKTNIWNIWWSFPCQRIPNRIARECADWFYSDEVLYSPAYKHWLDDNKCDDNFFIEFLENYYRRVPVYNLNPNIVDHIDYLLGGSIVNYRSEHVRSLMWEDDDLVLELARRLHENK